MNTPKASDPRFPGRLEIEHRGRSATVRFIGFPVGGDAFDAGTAAWKALPGGLIVEIDLRDVPFECCLESLLVLQLIMESGHTTVRCNRVWLEIIQLCDWRDLLGHPPVIVETNSPGA